MAEPVRLGEGPPPFQPDVSLTALLEERRADSQRRLYALGDGWPFGDGPLQWTCHIEVRDGQGHMVCDHCPQSIFCVAPDIKLRGFTWNLELLKSRVADHVLKVHPEAAT